MNNKIDKWFFWVLKKILLILFIPHDFVEAWMASNTLAS